MGENKGSIQGGVTALAFILHRIVGILALLMVKEHFRIISSRIGGIGVQKNRSEH